MLADICLPPFHVPMWKKLKQLSHWFGIDHFICSLFHLCPNQVCLRIHRFVCTMYNCSWLPDARCLPSSSARPKRDPVCSGSLDLVRAAVQLGGQFGRRSSLFPPGTQRERERAARAYNVAALGRYTSHSITTQPSIWPRYHILILNCLKIILWDKFKSIPPLGGNTCYTWKKLLFFCKTLLKYIWLACFLRNLHLWESFGTSSIADSS